MLTKTGSGWQPLTPTDRKTVTKSPAISLQSPLAPSYSHYHQPCPPSTTQIVATPQLLPDQPILGPSWELRDRLRTKYQRLQPGVITLSASQNFWSETSPTNQPTNMIKLIKTQCTPQFLALINLHFTF